MNLHYDQKKIAESKIEMSYFGFKCNLPFSPDRLIRDGLFCQNGKIFMSDSEGCYIFHQDGTIRYIGNSWYD